MTGSWTACCGDCTSECPCDGWHCGCTCGQHECDHDDEDGGKAMVDISALKTGDEVTVHPRYSGGGLDTEAGAQPWKATFLGFATDGRLIIQTGQGEYGSIRARMIDTDKLDPATARQPA